MTFKQIEDLVFNEVERLSQVPVYLDIRSEVEAPCAVVRFSGTEYDYRFYREDPTGSGQIGAAKVTHTLNVILTSSRSADDNAMRVELESMFNSIKSIPENLTADNPDQRWYWDSIESQEYDGELVDSPRSVNCIISVDEII